MRAEILFLTHLTGNDHVYIKKKWEGTDSRLINDDSSRARTHVYEVGDSSVTDTCRPLEQHRREREFMLK